MLQFSQFQNDELIVVDVEGGLAVEKDLVFAAAGEFTHVEGEPVGGRSKFLRKPAGGHVAVAVPGVVRKLQEISVDVVHLCSFTLVSVGPLDRIVEKLDLGIVGCGFFRGRIGHLCGDLGDDRQIMLFIHDMAEGIDRYLFLSEIEIPRLEKHGVLLV